MGVAQINPQALLGRRAPGDGELQGVEGAGDGLQLLVRRGGSDVGGYGQELLDGLGLDPGR